MSLHLWVCSTSLCSVTVLSETRNFLVALAVKVVHDVLLTGETDTVSNITTEIKVLFFGVPFLVLQDSFYFSALRIKRNESSEILIHADYNPGAPEWLPKSSARVKEVHDLLNPIE